VNARTHSPESTRSRSPDRPERFRDFAGLTFDAVAERLHVDPSRGLDDTDARTRFERVRKSIIERSAAANAWALFARQFRSPLVGILIFAVVVSAIAREWTDAGVVLGIVVLSATLSFVQEWRASRAVAELTSRISLRSRVLRSGELRTIPSSELVVGDIIELNAGGLVPADAVLVDAKDFLVDEAVLTGESFPVEKEVGSFARDTPLARCLSVIFAGSTVRSGRARALIVATGSESELGDVAARLRLRAAETDFEHGVRQFGILVSQVMLILVGVVFVLDVVTAKPPIDSLLFAIAIAVGMAPEMLPAVITITLSRGARAMAERGVIVRRLAAIENLGSMDVLCTDKTGTLTEGVVDLEAALGPDGSPSTNALVLAFTNSSLETGFTNPIDAAIITAAERAGVTLPPTTKIDEIPYDFVRKRLGIVFERGGTRTLVVKGAFRNVLDVCSAFRSDGSVLPLDPERRRALLASADTHAAEGLRVLGLATGSIDPGRAYEKEDEHDLVFEGFLNFSDPPKAGIAAALDALRRLGVDVKVVTGDSRAAAVHLAERVGLDATAVLTASEVGDLSDLALLHRAERTTIFAEFDPNQKERLILALRKAGRCVGYMGDGINDALALHAADVGISVESAVDVAKEAADFVLVKRDLDVLRAGIVEGRRTFANTLKYVFTTTSANFGNMLSMAVASAFLPFLPLLATQVLLNNFLSDFPAMTIADDGVDPELVERPRRWNVPEIRRFMLEFGTISSVFDVITFVYLYRLVAMTPAGFQTGWFVESLLTELVIVFVVRTRRRIYASRPAPLLVASSIAVAAVAVGLPYSPLARTFGLVALPASVLASLIGLTLAYAFVSEAAKGHFFRRAEADAARARVTLSRLRV